MNIIIIIVIIIIVIAISVFIIYYVKRNMATRNARNLTIEIKELGIENRKLSNKLKKV